MADEWKDTTAQAKMLESEKRTRQFLDLMDRFPQLGYEDVTRIVNVGVWQPKARKDMFYKIRAARTQGVPRPADIPNLEFHIREAVMDSFHMADKTAGLTGVGSMVFEWNVGIDPWRVHDIGYLLNANYGEGGYGVISGPPRKGKTNTGCVVMEKWIQSKPGRVAFSNIRGDTPQYKFTPNLLSLLWALADLPEGKEWRFILDEGNLTYAKADQVTRRVKDVDKIVHIVGKMWGNMDLIQHREAAVPQAFASFATNWVYCHEPGIVTVDLRGPNLTFRRKAHGFPRTRLPFDTRDWAYFSTKGVKINEVLEAVTGEEDRRGVLRDFLNDLGAERDGGPRPTKADRVRELIPIEADDYAIAGLVGTDVGYVRRLRKSVERS